jgi:glyoxalase family protein
MSERIPGIHHITAIAGDAQRNFDFYAGTLGLRLVKRTVNFDDPGTYHLYFGDERGRPGTILTFFPWPGAARGRPGTGEVSATAFAVPAGSLEFWAERLAAAGIATSRPGPRFGERVLALGDPDGMVLELIESAATTGRAAASGEGIGAGHAIVGFHSATLHLRARGRTEQLLTATLGFTPAGDEQGRRRFHAGGRGPGSIVDTIESPGARRGEAGAGSVHHIAWRTRDEAAQADWLERLPRVGLNVTPVQDRQYFHSIYFREPGGVLFEIATDPPGFAIDEPVERLGEELKLPPWLEPMRARIERTLPPLETRQAGQAR